MILDEEGDGDWVCIEPVVRVAGVELQFTFVIELALSKEVVFYFYMSQEEEGSPVLKGVGADARMSRYLDPRNLKRAALAPVLLRNVSPRHGSRGPVGSGQHGCGGTETLQGCRCIPNVGAEDARTILHPTIRPIFLKDLYKIPRNLYTLLPAPLISPMNLTELMPESYLRIKETGIRT